MTVTTDVTSAEAGRLLRDAVKRKASKAELAGLQRQLREARRADLEAEQEAAELKELERDAERERLAAERVALAKKADAVEAMARSDALALEVSVSYRGLVLKFRPGAVGDPTARLTCLADLGRAVTFLSRHQEDLIGVLRAGAKGQAPRAPMTAEQLAARLRDDSRRSIKRGLASVELGATE